MHTTETIVLVNPNATIPEDFLAALLVEKPNVWGVAIVSNGKVIVRHSNDPTVQKIQDLHKTFAAKNLVLHVGTLPTPIDDKSRQPFILENTAEGLPAIVAFVEGDYKMHTVKDGIGSDSYYMTQEVLSPLVNQFWQATGNNIEGTMTFMKNKMQQKTLIGAAGDRGTVTLVAANSDIHSISFNDQDAVFDWGETSRHHHYGQPQAEYPVKEEVVEKPAAKEMTEEELLELAMGGGTLSSPITPPSTTASNVPASQLSTTALKSTTASNIPTFTRINIKGWSNSQKKDLCDRCKIPRPANLPNLMYIDVPTNQVPVKDLAKAVKVEEPIKSDAPAPTGSVPAIPAHVDTPSTLMAPVVPLTQITAFQKVFLSSPEIVELMKLHAGKVPTEKELQDFEAAYPSWSKQTNVPIENTAFYSYTAFLLLCKEYPNLAAALLGTFRNGYFKNFKIQAPAVQFAQDNQRAIGNGSSKRR